MVDRPSHELSRPAVTAIALVVIIFIALIERSDLLS
jgi:hypothetical protein